MRIAVVCNDTRGGVQPYVALALGLREAGHEVRAVAPSDLAPLFSQFGFQTAALSGSIEAVLRGSGGVAERGMLATMRYAATEMPQRMRDWTQHTLQACEGVQLMTGGVGGMVIGLSVAEKLGVPFVQTHLQPVSAPTSAYPGVLMPWLPNWLGPTARRLSHHLSEQVVWAPFQRAMASARSDVLGLRGRATASDGQPVLYGISPHVLPMSLTAAGSVSSATNVQRHATGYWFLPEATSTVPPADLVAFLKRPGPVVSVGFGSMASKDPQAVAQLVVGAARDAGVRVVLLSGWGGLHALQDDADVYSISDVPHDWLFSRVAAIVHHGGAGTTAAAFRAGVPAVVVPFTMDQPFWALRVAQLGAGPKPIARRRLTRQRLADALRQAVTDEGMRTRAAQLGRLIRAEDGVHNAVRVFERIVA
jgi:sterol 3beta-glucosyltransferase